MRRLAYSQNNDIARLARIPLEPRPVFLLHSHWNTDLGDKLLQIVGQAISNHVVVLLIQHQKDTVAWEIFPLLQVFPRKADSYFSQENRRPQPVQC